MRTIFHENNMKLSVQIYIYLRMKRIGLILILLAILFYDTSMSYAQDNIEKDSIRKETNNAYFDNSLEAKDELKLPPKLLDNYGILNSISREERILTIPKFNIEPISKFYIDHETVRIMPYQYSFFNLMEGLTIQGVNGQFLLTDFLTANVNYYVSSTYFGEFQPNPYINNSLKMDVVLKLHDRVQLLGFGQVSVREGINPMIPSSLGGSNYYGAGILFKITDKIGIGFRVRNSYYRNNWTVRTDFLPVFY